MLDLILRVLVTTFYFFPIGMLLLLHGIYAWSGRWIILAFVVALVECVWSYWVIAHTANQLARAIVPCIFKKYSNCKFRRVPIEYYFAGEEQKETLTYIRVKRVRFVRVPQVIAVQPGTHGECLAIPCTYDTGIATYTFVPDMPSDDAPSTRFQILHELGHRSAGQPLAFEWVVKMSAGLWARMALFLPLFTVVHRSSLLLIGAVLCLYWGTLLNEFDNEALSAVKREVVADEYAVAGLAKDDCPLVNATFQNEWSAARYADAVAMNSSENLGSINPTGAIRWQIGSENLGRRMRDEKLTESPYVSGANPFPPAVCLFLLLGYEASQPWRWSQPSHAILYVAGLVALFHIVFAVKLGDDRNRQLAFCDELAPELEPGEIAAALKTTAQRRESEARFLRKEMRDLVMQGVAELRKRASDLEALIDD